MKADNISKQMMEEYYTLSNISMHILGQRFSSVVVCGEFSELVLKYLIQNNSHSNVGKTHDLDQLFRILVATVRKQDKQRVRGIYNSLSKETKRFLKTVNYVSYRYSESPRIVLTTIKKVYKACQELYIYLIC